MTMEKPTRSSKATNLFNFFTKPASFSISCPTYSPRRDHWNPRKLSSFNRTTTFSGPIVPLKKGGGFDAAAEEPTSPTVSCMGQIKLKKKASKDKIKKEKKEKKEKKKKSLSGSNTFHVKEKEMRQREVEYAPAVGEMRRFASGRERLGDFDWRKVERKAKVAPGDSSGDEEEEEEVIIPHSAPMVLGGGGGSLEKGKEVSLWKRRIMARPPPLQIK